MFHVLRAFLARLKFPQLFMLAGFLFLADLAIPDLIPYVDEVMLGVLTVLLSQWKRRGRELPADKPPTKNVTPDRS